jgi:prepilin-type N-terminal cleavage/methylation domain-containing protein
MEIVSKNRAVRCGYTLVEVLVSLLVVGIMVSGLVAGFMQAHKQAEWSAYNLAAQSLAIQPLEQARAAKWDPYANPPVDNLWNSNFPPTTNILDIPVSGTNLVFATNRVNIRSISTNPPLKEISVVTTWRFMNRGTFSNTAVTYRAPDQ